MLWYDKNHVGACIENQEGNLNFVGNLEGSLVIHYCRLDFANHRSSKVTRFTTWRVQPINLFLEDGMPNQRFKDQKLFIFRKFSVGRYEFLDLWLSEFSELENIYFIESDMLYSDPIRQ